MSQQHITPFKLELFDIMAVNLFRLCKFEDHEIVDANKNALSENERIIAIAGGQSKVILKFTLTSVISVVTQISYYFSMRHKI